MQRLVILFAGLVLTWCLLSGHFSVLLLTLGVLSCLLCLAVFHRIDRAVIPPRLNIKTVPQVRYLAWLAVEIVKSNIDVMKAVVDPGRIKPQMFEVEGGNLEEPGRVIYANSITLTPGTVTVDVGEDRLLVHSLVQQTRDDLESKRMLHRVESLRGKEKS